MQSLKALSIPDVALHSNLVKSYNQITGMKTGPGRIRGSFSNFADH